MKNTDKTPRERDKELRGLPLRWADAINVVPEPGVLFVYGGRKIRTTTNLMKHYDKEEEFPYLRFANCCNESDLIRFVAEFGPVVASEVTSGSENSNSKRILRTLDEVERDGFGQTEDAYWAEMERRMHAHEDSYDRRIAVQRLDELRCEHTLFKAMVDLTRLLLKPSAKLPLRRAVKSSKSSKSATGGEEQRREELQRLVGLANTIAEGTRVWAEQFKREGESLRASEMQVIPEWRWGEIEQRRLDNLVERARSGLDRSASRSPVTDHDPSSCAQQVICTVLDAFPPTLNWSRDSVSELPPYELFHGIRPLLFAMLRRHLLAKREIRMCRRQGCGNLFPVTRPDKHCCSTDCSRKEAANRHYWTKRRPARRKASKSRSSKKRSTKAGTKKG